jgi:hypothetical protein
MDIEPQVYGPDRFQYGFVSVQPGRVSGGQIGRDGLTTRTTIVVSYPGSVGSTSVIVESPRSNSCPDVTRD